MNGKKLAQKVRTEDKLLIERTEQDYWISNTYFAVKVNKYDFEDFKSKYNSYKSTETIRELPEVGEVLDYSNGHFNVSDNTPVSNVVSGLNDLKQAVLTDLILKDDKMNLRVYQVKGKIGHFDNKHNWLLKLTNYNQVFTEGLKQPVVFKNAAGEINLLIMPIRSNGEKFKQEIDKLNINLELDNEPHNEPELEPDNEPELEPEDNTKLKRDIDKVDNKKWVKKNKAQEDKPKPQEKEKKEDNDKKKTAVAVKEKEEGNFALVTEEELKNIDVEKKEFLGTNLGLDYKPKKYYVVKVA